MTRLRLVAFAALVIVRPLLRKILRDMGVNPDEYERLLKEL